MLNRQAIRLAGLAAAIVLLGSCAMRQEALVRPDGSGSAQFRIEIAPFFLDYIRDMGELAGDAAIQEGQIFDLPAIREGFETRPGVKVTRLSSPAPAILEGELTFQDIEAVFRSEARLAEAGIVSFTRRGSTRTLRLYLDRNNFAQVSALFPILENPLMSSLGPEENEGVTEEEYLDMMEFAMGEQAPPGIRASTIELTVRVQGRLVSQSGGEIRDGRAVFRIPIIRALLLDRPLEYSLTFE